MFAAHDEEFPGHDTEVRIEDGSRATFRIALAVIAVAAFGQNSPWKVDVNEKPLEGRVLTFGQALDGVVDTVNTVLRALLPKVCVLISR